MEPEPKSFNPHLVLYMMIITIGAMMSSIKSIFGNIPLDLAATICKTGEGLDEWYLWLRERVKTK